MILPTVTVFKNGKGMIVNESDLERFRAEGWALPEVVPEVPVVPAIQPEVVPVKGKRSKADKSDE